MDSTQFLHLETHKSYLDITDDTVGKPGMPGTAWFYDNMINGILDCNYSLQKMSLETFHIVCRLNLQMNLQFWGYMLKKHWIHRQEGQEDI